MESLETIAAGPTHEIMNPLNHLKNTLLTLECDTRALVEALRGPLRSKREPGKGSEFLTRLSSAAAYEAVR